MAKVAYRYKTPAKVGSRGELNMYSATCARGSGGTSEVWNARLRLPRGTVDHLRILTGELRMIQKERVRPSVQVAPGVRRRVK